MPKTTKRDDRAAAALAVRQAVWAERRAAAWKTRRARLDVRDAAILAAARDKIPPADIARAHGLTVMRVQQILRGRRSAAELAARRAARQARNAAIVGERRAGQTLAAIGRTYGLTRERVRQILAALPNQRQDVAA